MARVPRAITACKINRIGPFFLPSFLHRSSLTFPARSGPWNFLPAERGGKEEEEEEDAHAYFRLSLSPPILLPPSALRRGPRGGLIRVEVNKQTTSSLGN